MIISIIFIILLAGFVIATVYSVKKGNVPAQEANDDLESGNNGIIDDLFD